MTVSRCASGTYSSTVMKTYMLLSAGMLILMLGRCEGPVLTGPVRGRLGRTCSSMETVGRWSAHARRFVRPIYALGGARKDRGLTINVKCGQLCCLSNCWLTYWRGIVKCHGFCV